MEQRRDDQIMKGSQYEDRRLKQPAVQVQNQVLQKCPRCDSVNTKFCYYNNYSLSQPRYLCKTCRRYWTQGGTLRNVPIGGGSRKPKRPNYKQSSPQPPPPPQIIPSSLTTTPQQVIFSGTPVITTSSFFNPGSSSSWINYSFGTLSQGQCQIDAPAEIMYEMMDQSSGKTILSSNSQAAGWPGESYINNSIANSMAGAGGDAIVWTTAGNNNNAAADVSNPTNNSGTTIIQWPDYMPGYCPPP